MSELISATRTFFSDETRHPLGRLTLAGTIRNSRGVGERQLRVYGRYALVLLCAGGGHYRDENGTRIEVSAGDAIWVFPELPHTYGPRAAPVRGSEAGRWDEIFVCFDGPIFDLWRREGVLDAARPVTQPPNFETTFAQLKQFLEHPRPADETEHLQALSEFQAILVAALSPARSIPREVPWLSRAKAMLESNLDRSLSGPEVARVAGLSYEAFRKSFTREIGVSPARYRTLRRVEAAKRLLEDGELPHGAIARSLGFRDEAHLARRFREVLGTTPREVRLQHRRNLEKQQPASENAGC